MKPTNRPLLPGLRWEGKLTVLCKQDGRYLVDFDAVDPKAHQNERHVMDRAALTEKELKDWTGWGGDLEQIS